MLSQLKTFLLILNEDFNTNGLIIISNTSKAQNSLIFHLSFDYIFHRNILGSHV